MKVSNSDLLHTAYQLTQVSQELSPNLPVTLPQISIASHRAGGVISKSGTKSLDGDMIILHQQEHFLQERQSVESWKTAYKLPTSADRLIIEFRNWFDKYAGGELPWHKVGIKVPQNSLLTINDNRQALLDRYKQHTKNCSSCRKALKNLQRLQIAFVAYFAIIISVVATLPDALRIKFGLPLMLTGLLSLAAFAWLKFWLIPQFYFQDYSHPDKD